MCTIGENIWPLWPSVSSSIKFRIWSGWFLMNIHSLLWGKNSLEGFEEKAKWKGTEQSRVLDTSWFAKAPNTSLYTESPQEMKGLFLPNDFISIPCGARETRLTLFIPLPWSSASSPLTSFTSPLCCGEQPYRRWAQGSQWEVLWTELCHLKKVCCRPNLWHFWIWLYLKTAPLQK